MLTIWTSANASEKWFPYTHKLWILDIAVIIRMPFSFFIHNVRDKRQIKSGGDDLAMPQILMGCKNSGFNSGFNYKSNSAQHFKPFCRIIDPSWYRRVCISNDESVPLPVFFSVASFGSGYWIRLQGCLSVPLKLVYSVERFTSPRVGSKLPSICFLWDVGSPYLCYVIRFGGYVWQPGVHP